MINQAPYIRTGLYSLLNGAVTYGGNAVPVYEGEGVVKIPYQILIGEASSTDRSTKRSFTEEWTQTIEVVAEQPTEVREHVDAIGNEVMNLLKPAPRTTGLDLTNELQLISIKKTGQSYLTDYTGKGDKLVRLIMRFTFLINQINV